MLLSREMSGLRAAATRSSPNAQAVPARPVSKARRSQAMVNGIIPGKQAARRLFGWPVAPRDFWI
ncbi:MAG TPA: hypothetical protein DCG90_15820 [Sphingobium sp.]|jgi:hypothetical protein|nr:hypothetical protein [Sphingobium sp.]